MKRNFLKRSLAFAVAAAMTVSSVPANLAFAEEEIIDEPLVIEEAIDDAEGADTGAAETVQQIATSEPVAVQVEGVEQIGSEEVPADVAADAGAIAPISMADPIWKVSNLRVEEDELLWEVDESYGGYEYSITDGTYTYFSSVNENTPNYVIKYSNYYDGVHDLPSIINSATAYSNATGAWTKVLVNPADPESDAIESLRDGVTYKIDVRPLGTTYDYDEGEYVKVKEGPWTGTPVEYTYKKEDTTVTKPAAPTDFRYVVDDNGNAYLKWNAPTSGRVDRYRLVITDDNYRYGDLDSRYDEAAQKYVYDFSDFQIDSSSSSYLLNDSRFYSCYAYEKSQIGTGVGIERIDPVEVDGNYVSPFEAGKTYKVQIYAENYAYDAGKYVSMTSDLSAEVTVTMPAAETAVGKVENLELKEDEAGEEYLSWQEVESQGNTVYYEIAVTDAANVKVASARGINYSSYHINSLFDETDLAPGTYTITVRAYVWKWDDDSDEDIESYGEAATLPYTVNTIQGKSDATPEKVTGLVIKTDNEDVYLEGKYSNPVIAWNTSENQDVERYDIELKDAAGNTYYTAYEVTVDQSTNARTEKPTYYYNTGRKSTSVTAQDFANCYAYTLPADASLTRVTGADGKFLTGFDAGQTYTVRVRAVDKYWEYNTTTKGWETKDNAGEWSDAKSYQIAALSAITNLKYVPDKTGRKDNSYYYFSFDAAPGTVYYQISTDPTFPEDNPNTKGFSGYYSYTVGNNTTSKLIIPKSYFSLPNTTYYIRVVNALGGNSYNYDDDYSKVPTQKEADELMAANPGMMTSFVTDPVETAKTITGLKMIEETSWAFEFTFDPILDEGDKYEFQYSKDQVTWESMNGAYLRKENMEEGVTYYVRAVAYITDLDGKRVDGTPSNMWSGAVNRAAGAVTGFAVKKNRLGYEFSCTNKFKNNEYVQVQVADSKEFVQQGDRTMIESSIRDYGYSPDSYNVHVSYSELTPGKTYYARARVVSDGAKEGERYGQWTTPIKITPKVVKINVSTRGVGSTALYLSMDQLNNEDYLSGYQIQRKIGKKWVTLTYTTDEEYKDTGLTAQTKYQYRVRPYYYIAKTKKYVYGSFVNCEVMTWGGSLNLEVKATSKTAAKLTWNKIAGAEGYEIYRNVMTSVGNTKDKTGDYENAYTSEKLVKTIKKASVKSYTDKKLISGMSYTYTVRAFKTIGKEKYYISDGDTVNLSLKNFKIVDVTYLKNGKVKVTWTPVFTAKGYLIEKYDEETQQWSTQKNIKKAKTSSYTLPANKTEQVRYRIRAYDKSNEYSAAQPVYTNPLLKAPTNVKAVVQKDGSVKVTWKKVSGADYYIVYRTTSSKSYYHKALKTYVYGDVDYDYYDYGDDHPNDDAVTLVNYVADETALSGYRAAEPDELTGTTLYDRKISYQTASGVTNTLWKGPQEGVQYYYYVEAVKKGEAHIFKNNGEWEEKDTVVSSSSKQATATVVKKVLPKPTKVTAKASAGKVKVSWKKVKGAQGYVVYRSTKQKSGYVPVGYIAKAKTKTYTDKTAKKGKTYYYKVCAYKISAVGSYQYSADSKPKKVKAK